MNNETVRQPLRLSRRSFGKTATGTLASPVVLAASYQNSDGPTQEIDAKYVNVIRKYGRRLSEEQRKRIRTILETHQRMIDRVRAFPLENADAPATGLRLVLDDRGR